MQQLSVWEKESFFAPKDITIIGSGLVGLWSAYYLKKHQPDLSISILDRGVIPTGASTRNAGFACFGSATELIADRKMMGEDKMLELVEMRFKGLRKIRKVFHDREIGFEPAGGYELISPEQNMDLNSIRSHLDGLNRLLRSIVGKNKTFHLDDAKISSFGFGHTKHLIENRMEGQLHSGKLCEALLKKVQSMGVTVLNGIEVRAFDKQSDRVGIDSNLPFRLSAGKLLICTNAFARELLPQLNVEPARGQILVTSPIPNLRFRGTFHHDEGFYYFRNLGDRVLLGGARNKAIEEEHTNTLATTDKIQDELERFLREVILPNTSYRIDYRWSGIMGVGDEKMPIVGRIDDRIFSAVRMGGMGVALAPVMGKKIAEQLRS